MQELLAFMDAPLLIENVPFFMTMLTLWTLSLSFVIAFCLLYIREQVILLRTLPVEEAAEEYEAQPIKRQGYITSRYYADWGNGDLFQPTVGYTNG